MKTLRFIFAFSIIGLYSCSSIYTSDVYTDDVYYNHKKDSEKSKYSAYSPSATYNNAPVASQTSTNTATPNKNLDYSQAQNYYNTQPANDANDAQLNGSYSERIAKFYGPMDSVDYNSPVYSTVVDPNSNVNVYVNNYPQEQAYYDDNSNWNFSVGIGVGYGVGFYGGYGYPYYGYYDPFYGYGYPYYGYGYPYYPYYGCGYPSYGCGGVYVSPYSEYNYGPRPNGGSTAVGSQGGSSSTRAPRSVSNQNLAPTVNPLKDSGAERYTQTQRSSSYSSYSRTSKSATIKSTQSGTNGTTQPVTYRRSYTPTYNEPATNARTQYNNSNYTRPTSTTVNRNTQSSTIKSSDSRPTVVDSQPASKPTNTQTYQRSSSSAPSTPSYNSGGSSSGGGRSSGGSMGGGGSSGGGGSRSPRR